MPSREQFRGVGACVSQEKIRGAIAIAGNQVRLKMLERDIPSVATDQWSNPLRALWLVAIQGHDDRLSLPGA